MTVLAMVGVVVMASVMSRSAWYLWHGKVPVGRAVVPLQSVRGRMGLTDKFWWAQLRCSLAISVSFWGACIASVIFLRPSSCYSAGCDVLITVAVLGMGVFFLGGAVMFFVYFTNRPKIFVPPILREHPGALAWDRGERPKLHHASAPHEHR